MIKFARSDYVIEIENLRKYFVEEKIFVTEHAAIIKSTTLGTNAIEPITFPTLRGTYD